MKNQGNQYSLSGLVATIILFVVGIVIILSTGVTNINSLASFKEYLHGKGDLFIISLFFVVVPVYAWFLWIKNVIIKPKKEVLYLLGIDDNNICSFLNSKGKKYFFDNNNYEIEKFYDVLKTKDKIDKIIGISNENFDIPEVKESYWLNFYSPVGNFENLLVLPILYIILIPGLLSFIVSIGFDKIYGFIFMIFPLGFIIYDGIYKIKKIGLKEDEKVDTKTLDKIYGLIPLIMDIIGIFVSLAISIWLFSGLLNMKYIISKLTMLPLCLILLTMLIYQIFQVFKQYHIMDIMEKIMVIIFLLFWFSISLVATGLSIKTKKYEMLIIIIPFYLAGIYIIYDKLIKKK